MSFSKNIAKVGTFLRLVDENSQLSMTNVALFVILGKVSAAHDVSMADLGALLVTLLHYSGKKVLAHVKEKLVKNEALDALKADLQKLTDRASKQDGLGAMQAALGRKTT